MCLSHALALFAEIGMMHFCTWYTDINYPIDGHLDCEDYTLPTYMMPLWNTRQW